MQETRGRRGRKKGIRVQPANRFASPCFCLDIVVVVIVTVVVVKSRNKIKIETLTEKRFVFEDTLSSWWLVSN